MSDSSAVLVMQQQFCQTTQVRRSLATSRQNSVMLRAKSLLEERCDVVTECWLSKQLLCKPSSLCQHDCVEATQSRDGKDDVRKHVFLICDEDKRPNDST